MLFFFGTQCILISTVNNLGDKILPCLTPDITLKNPDIASIHLTLLVWQFCSNFTISWSGRHGCGCFWKNSLTTWMDLVKSILVYSAVTSQVTRRAELGIISHLEKSGKHVELCWIPSHVGITGNEKTDAAAKAALCQQITFSKLPATILLLLIYSVHCLSFHGTEWPIRCWCAVKKLYTQSLFFITLEPTAGIIAWFFYTTWKCAWLPTQIPAVDRRHPHPPCSDCNRWHSEVWWQVGRLNFFPVSTQRLVWSVVNRWTIFAFLFDLSCKARYFTASRPVCDAMNLLSPFAMLRLASSRGKLRRVGRTVTTTLVWRSSRYCVRTGDM